jgi:ribose transport system substrate-binding protein
MTFVGTDVYNAGFAAGKAVGEKIGDDARVGISMVPGFDRVIGTINGFTDGLAEAAPGAQIIAEVNDESDVNKAEQVLTAMLQAHPEINTIFCATGVPGVGAVKATINVGRNTGDDRVHVMAYAQDVHILEMIESEELMATVAQNPYLMGQQSFYQLWAAAHPTQFKNVEYPGFGNIPAASIDTGANIVFKGDPLIEQYMTPPTIK